MELLGSSLVGKLGHIIPVLGQDGLYNCRVDALPWRPPAFCSKNGEIVVKEVVLLGQARVEVLNERKLQIQRCDKENNASKG